MRSSRLMWRGLQPANLAILSAFLIATAGLAQGPAPAPPPEKQPRLIVEDPIFDFGDVGLNAILTHEFLVRNDGDADLHIDNLVPGCACTAVSSDPVVHPGASGNVRVVLETSGMTGAVGKQVVVYSNDPLSPRTILTVRARIAAHTVVNPETLRLTAIAGDRQGTAAATFWVDDRGDLVIKKVESPSPFVWLSFRELLGAERDAGGKGRQWRIDAVLDPAAPLGSVSGLASVYTNHPSESVVTIPVVVFVRPALAITPQRLDLGDVSITPGFFRSLSLESLGSGVVRILKIESDVPGVRATYEAQPDGRHILIKLVLAPSLPRGPFKGSLVVTTSAPTMPRIEIPISGNVL